MEPGDLVREIDRQRAGDPAARRDDVEQSLLREPPHHHDPLDRFAGAAQSQFPARPPHDGFDRQIELRRGPPVQLQLTPARLLPAFQRRIVHVRETDRTLHLAGAVAGEEDDGTMRFVALDGGPSPATIPSAVSAMTEVRPRRSILVMCTST